MKLFNILFTVLIASLILAGCLGEPKKVTSNDSIANTTEVQDIPLETGEISTLSKINATSLPALLKELKKSVVHISYSGEHAQDYWEETEFGFTGSGVVYSVENGKVYVLTNRHVVDFNFPDPKGKIESENITIQTSDGRQFSPSSRLIAPDKMDLAILVFDINGTNLTSASFSDVLPEEGEEVIIIGMPEELNWSVSKGIVSGIRTSDTIGIENGNRTTVIQTDAAVNSGNSGGGMFAIDGRLIGINTWKYGWVSEGLNFAISVKNFPSLKDRFIKFQIKKPGVNQPPSSPAVSIGEIRLGELNDDLDSFNISFIVLDPNGIPTSYTGPLRITLKDGNKTLMYEHSGAVSMIDFVERPGYPFYGIRSYSLNVPLAKVKKTDSYYANITVEISPASGKINKTTEVYVPDYLYQTDYWGDSSGDSQASSGTSSQDMKDIGMVASNGGIEVTLSKAGLGDDYYGPYYETEISVKNNNLDKKDIEITEATLITNGKQYSADYYSSDLYLGNIYPGASLDKQLVFYDVPKAGDSATIYLTLSVYENGDYDYYSTPQVLEYKYDFKP